MQTMFSHPGLQEYAARMRERRFNVVKELRDHLTMVFPVRS